jgi:hypothetical protein
VPAQHRHVAEPLGDAPPHNLVGAARAALGAAAAQRGAAIGDLATTIITVVADHELVAAAQVGDGAAVVRDADGGLVALTTPRNGEYANETTFLSAPGALDSAQCALRRGGATHVAALSDGLQMLALAMPSGAPHAPFFTPLFRFASETADGREAGAQLRAFLAGPRVTARTDDDVTLLLAARTAG